VTLKFEKAPLKQVVRELCRQAGWHVLGRFGKGFHLFPGAEKDDRPRCMVEGYEIGLNSVSISDVRSLDLKDRGQPVQVQHDLQLQVSVEGVLDEAMGAMYGLHPAVRAVTDTGLILAPRQTELMSGGYWGSQPVVQTMIALEPPTDNSTKLVSLEGDLVLYADVEHAEFEFGLDEKGTTKKTDQATVTFKGYAPEDCSVSFELAIPANPPPAAGQPYWSLNPQYEVSLLGADGAGRAPNSANSGGSGDGKTLRYQQRFGFDQAQGFQPTKVSYKVTVPRNPTKRVRYKFENVPLPVAK
jgi:hypothetical protein